tara:strand:+ start:673 stop:1485 length:813 start_codon:yes stop_codon:yes gene_type:complete
MKLTIITGDHYRHLYLVDKIHKLGLDVSWIIQKRENIQPKLYHENKDILKLLKIHFDKRENAELNFFSKTAGNIAKKNISKIKFINEDDILNGNLYNLLKTDFKADILFTYGPSKIIPKKILNLAKLYKWNVHGGLSPWYRGTATLFWPTYLLEPEFTGITLHEMSDIPDAGNIIHQTGIKISPKDGIHENACRAVKEFSDSLPKLLAKKLKKNKNLKGIPQHTYGRNWTEKMWHPLTLKVIYDLFNDKINQYCIKNKKIKYPKLKSILL